MRFLALVLFLSFSEQILALDEERQLDLIFDSGDRENNANNELCWERCFQVEDTDDERFREVYDDIYRIGMDLRKLKNMYAVNATALMLDSTLASFHDDAALDLSVEDTADAIWQFQKHLAGIVTMLTGADDDHNPFFIYQFNENDAYTCEKFGCLDACEVMSQLENELDDIQTGTNSYKDGNINAACGMAKRKMQTTSCNATIRNEMAIAILNSDIHFDKVGHSSSSYSSSSSSSSSESWEDGQGPCYAHFDTRYAIGTHAAGWDEINKFSSRAAKGFYLHDNEYTMKAVTELHRCINTRCCPLDGTPDSLDTYPWWDESIEAGECYITNEHYGLTDVDYNGHDGED